MNTDINTQKTSSDYILRNKLNCLLDEWSVRQKLSLVHYSSVLEI